MAYDITAAALAAKQASQAASLLSTKEKNDALTAMPCAGGTGGTVCWKPTPWTWRRQRKTECPP